MMNLRSFGAWAAVAAMAFMASCGAEPTESAGKSEGTESSAALASSPEAKVRIEALRDRFHITPIAAPPVPHALGPAPDLKPAAVIGAGVGATFERTASETVRAVVPTDARRGVARTASVELPMRASGFARLEDDTSHMSVRFALREAKDVPVAMADGMALYAGALGGGRGRGSDIVHRVSAEGTEDFVVFEARPAREELAYDVDVSRVAGLRLVENTLEFVDEGGSPRLRVAPPYVVDAKGERHGAKLAVEGCAYDANPAGPWGRAVTRAGSARCAVRVAWERVAYPAIVDPMWTATGSMATARHYHTASVLGSGKVLVAGGYGGDYLTSAELYDPLAGTFAATGSMAKARGSHTASVLGSGKVLIAGGWGSGPALASAELYDPLAGTFAATGSMATARGSHTASVLGSGKVLVVGGYGGDYLTSAELYDPLAGTFAATDSMAMPRLDHTASVLGSGQVLVAGGYNGNMVLASAQLYNPPTGTFIATGSMATARYGHTASMLGSGKVLVAGGYNNGNMALASAELYNPATGTFTAAGSMATARYGHTASVLGSGKVLVAGGCGYGGDYLTSAELYGPAIGAFAASASMATSREHPTASVLGSGKVLVAGGIGVNGIGILASAEVYDDAACASDANFCDAGSYCAANGTCQPRKAQGAACELALDCKVAGCRECSGAGNGNCVDGVCCNDPCNGSPCQVCAAALGAPADGTCGTAAAGIEHGTCQSPQMCNGVSDSCPAGCATDADCAPTGYCSSNATCLPRKSQAQVCNAGAGADCKVAGCRVCTSSNCVDGFCCNSACGPCGSCSLPQAGTCTPKAKDLPPTPAGACGLYLCDGGNATCPVSCSTNADCIVGDFCVKGGCVTKLPQGAPCGSNAECQTSFCADGVCCDTSCAGTCMACAAANKQSGVSNGVCGVAKLGTNPGGQCAADPVNVCGTTSACVGTSAACAFTPAGTTCGPTSCANGFVSGKICNGLGTCGDALAQPCTPYICQNDACSSPCAGDSDCVTSFYCSNGVCLPQSDSGKACTLAHECKLGFCADGVCCDAPCSGSCQACAEPGKLGACTTVTGTPRLPRSPCTGTGVCQGKCDGVDASACAYPDMAKACGVAASCTGNVSQPGGACDGSGSCATPGTKNCPPYGCDAAKGVCKTSCVSSADCSNGVTCDTVSGQCTGGQSTCSDTFTVKSSNGQLVSCAPYKCLNGACQQQCVATSDCAEGLACKSSKCVEQGGAGTGGAPAASSPAAETPSGCGCRVAGSEGDDHRTALAAFSLAALAVVVARRRRGARAGCACVARLANRGG